MKAFSRNVLAVLVLGTVTALAQPDPGKTSKPATAMPSTPAELSARADTLSVQIQSDYKDALRVRDVAKRQKDVIKLNCVNDRLVEMKAQMNLADAAKAKANASAAEGNVSDDAKSAFGQLASNAEGIRLLREQAEACIGGTELLRQESGLQVDSPVIVDDPTIIDPFESGDVGGVVEPPGYSSAFD